MRGGDAMGRPLGCSGWGGSEGRLGGGGAEVSPETLASVSTRVLDCELSVCDLDDKIRF